MAPRAPFRNPALILPGQSVRLRAGHCHNRFTRRSVCENRGAQTIHVATVNGSVALRRRVYRASQYGCCAPWMPGGDGAGPARKGSVRWSVARGSTAPIARRPKTCVVWDRSGCRIRPFATSSGRRAGKLTMLSGLRLSARPSRPSSADASGSGSRSIAAARAAAVAQAGAAEIIP